MTTICVQPKMLKSSETSGVVCMDEGQECMESGKLHYEGGAACMCGR